MDGTRHRYINPFRMDSWLLSVFDDRRELYAVAMRAGKMVCELLQYSKCRECVQTGCIQACKGGVVSHISPLSFEIDPASAHRRSRQEQAKKSIKLLIIVQMLTTCSKF